MVKQRTFREDLYYRLKVFPIDVPPLRQRSEDIPKLVQHFTALYARRMNKTIADIPSETIDALVRYTWPGNIRELQNFIGLQDAEASHQSPGLRTQRLCQRSRHEHVTKVLTKSRHRRRSVTSSSE